MTYFLDFDRTLFDTDAFIAYLKEHPIAGALDASDEMTFANALDAHAGAGSLTFAPGELSRFLYPDATGFLLDKGNSAMIITYGNRALQEAKIQSVLASIPRIAVMYTNEVRKGEYLAPHITMYGQSPVFVDDTPEELAIMTERCPGVQAFQMCRDGREGDGRWPVVRALSELP